MARTDGSFSETGAGNEGENMPNKEDHFGEGFLVGVFASAIIQRSQGSEVDWSRAIRNGFIGGIGALMPDAAEPAISPRHRGIGHSLLVGGLITNSAINIWNDSSLDGAKKEALLCLTAGFLSHLVADSDTPAGLPLIR